VISLANVVSGFRLLLTRGYQIQKINSVAIEAHFVTHTHTHHTTNDDHITALFACERAGKNSAYVTQSDENSQKETFCNTAETTQTKQWKIKQITFETTATINTKYSITFNDVKAYSYFVVYNAESPNRTR
jgi:beta-lactamase superfamily II metal-dependent hydrolase